MQTIKWTNQSSKQIHVAGAKHGKTQVRIGFGFTTDWLIEWCKVFFSQSQSLAMQSQSNYEISFDIQLKTALLT